MVRKDVSSVVRIDLGKYIGSSPPLINWVSNFCPNNSSKQVISWHNRVSSKVCNVIRLNSSTLKLKGKGNNPHSKNVNNTCFHRNCFALNPILTFYNNTLAIRTTH